MAEEKYGVENISKFVKTAGKAATAIANKSGLWSYVGPLMDLSSVNFSQVDEEVKDLSVPEIEGLAKDLSDAYQPNDKVSDLKLDEFIGLLKRSAIVVKEGVDKGIEIYATVQVLVEDWKKVLGVQ